MPTSQNVLFTSSLPSDSEFAHPPGEALALRLERSLGERGWRAEERDNWRDVGWSIDCERGASALTIAFACVEPLKWLLQVSPLHVPGLLKRLVGRTNSASPADCFELANVVHETLAETEGLSNFRWRWDGMPDDATFTSEPGPPAN